MFISILIIMGYCGWAGIERPIVLVILSILCGCWHIAKAIEEKEYNCKCED
jgi:hypothetical protein